MPDRPALVVDERTLTYSQLRRQAASIAATLQRRLPQGASLLTGVFADRSVTTFTGILGALFAGHTYVPLNVCFPPARTKWMLERAGCDSLIVDTRAEARLDDLLDGIERPLLVVMPERLNVESMARRWPVHQFVDASSFVAEHEWQERSVDSDAGAYLLFTSGSSGVPKGVAVTHGNATHFVHTMIDRYDFSSEDRFSQMFETTFDLSVFDMFLAWHHGACLCCPPRSVLLNPDRFIRESEITVWFSVPSVALLMDRFGALTPRRYPSLRWSLFCGEPLPIELAGKWSTAAAGSTIENLYGPTELTVACTVHRWSPSQSRTESSDGLVPIGLPIRGMRARVVDEQLVDVGPGEVGELLMAGPQCTNGYWLDEEATQRAFVQLNAGDEVYYRTGDRVRRSAGDVLQYVGRSDQQIKVLGHRVELGEIEALLRKESGVQEAVAIGWPQTPTGSAGVVAFVTGENLDIPAVLLRLEAKLQSYAVPQTIRVLPTLPQNSNGKVDRQALRRLLEAS